MAYSQQVFLFGKRRGRGESIWDIKHRINYLGPEIISYLNTRYISITGREYIINQHKNLSNTALNDILRHFDTNAFADKPVKFLSSGELQLMLIVSSLLSGKELLLLDEPFQFLDPPMKARVCTYIQSTLRSDTTLILITHYENDIAQWTNHRMCL
jgi:molybdate transport system ATP-binding protein